MDDVFRSFWRDLKLDGMRDNLKSGRRGMWPECGTRYKGWKHFFGSSISAHFNMFNQEMRNKFEIEGRMWDEKRQITPTQ